MAETDGSTAQTNAESPWSAQEASGEDGPFAQHPELFAGAALLGGFVLAQVLKRIGEDD